MYSTKVRAALGKQYVFEPHGAALLAFTEKSDELLLAGPKGTGKSLGLLHKGHLLLSKYPMAKGLMCRKTRQSMTMSCLDMFTRFVLKLEDKVTQHKQDQHFLYPNKSIWAYGGIDEPLKLQSSEWDFIYVQEATELTENDWEMLTGLLRSGIIPYQQLMADCNPDKPTHWLKRRADTGKTVMLESKHEDNPKYYDHKKKRPTKIGEQYFGKLKRLSGHRYKRLYQGIWAAAEGMVYEKYDPEIHLINRQDLPKHHREWPHYWSIDWGHIHPLVWDDWIENPENGVIYLNRQFYHTKMLVEDAARYVRDCTEGLYIPRATICDHDAEDRKTWERHITTVYDPRFLTLPAYKPIQRGIEAVQARLWGNNKDAATPNWNNTGGPGIYFIRDSNIKVDADLKDAGLPTSTIEEIDGYVWDKKFNENQANSKKDELPVDKDNHGMDTMRYVVAFLDSIAEDLQEVDELIELGEEIIISPY